MSDEQNEINNQYNDLKTVINDAARVKADINATRFSAVSMPITGPATEYIGMLSDGTALVAAGLDVYAVTVP